MDTSETFIKMCDCLEIQGQKPNIAYQLVDGTEFIFTRAEYVHEIDKIGRGRDIWLPRQDELQEMVKESSLEVLLDKFYGFYQTEWWYQNSMEQLWLAFMMSQLHQKLWNGSVWVKNGWIDE